MHAGAYLYTPRVNVALSYRDTATHNLPMRAPGVPFSAKQAPAHAGYGHAILFKIVVPVECYVLVYY